MILNHKAAIDLLVGQSAEVGFNRYTICSLHALLSDNLLADPRACGRLRSIGVGVGGAVFRPLEGPQLIEECFQQILDTATAIKDGFEQAFFVLILAPEFYLPLRLLGTRFHAGTAGVAAAQRIFAILATEDGGPMPVDGRPWTDKGRRTKDERRTAASSVLRPPSSVFRPSLRIRFEDVHYAYAEEDRPALSELSFEIEPGQRVALAGPSGSGKSTVAHLLLRFMAPTRGLITVDGVPLSDLALAEWRAQVAWVPQMPYLFHDTVAANIRLARPDASRDDVSAAARLAHAHSFIEQLPLGYDTVIGERGARLSGGQAQRLALARAFLKDAPFLILDEASANLDPEHVALLQESIDRLAAGRTLLVIAHRLSTLRQADQIIVLADGHAVEVGTHATLLQRDGLYRRLALAHGGVA
jgi:ABC-type multidrug transport system fused ATPase/permease subunit